MAGEEHVEGSQRESRFINLLQPNKDLASNWTVDVEKQLESYLAELASTGLFDEGQGSLNFAEAALLIQGSIQVYSRKVEYLYALVLQVLNFIGQNKQGEEGNPSGRGDDQNADITEENEDEFLNLDDLHEESNIDILDEEGVSSVRSGVKIPASLLASEADPIDISGEAGELATYETATCIMHRTFLLLDPCDAQTVDAYLDGGDHRRDKGPAPPTPGSAVRARTPISKGVTPSKRPGSAGKSANPSTPLGAVSEGGGAFECGPDWHEDCADGGMGWDNPDVSERQVNQDLRDEVAAEGHEAADFRDACSEEDEYVDPWAPLNPHEPGTLTVNPFKKGPTQRKKPKLKKERNSSLPVASRTGVCFPEFLKALQVRERLERAERRQERPNDPPSFENLRNSFGNSDTGLRAETTFETNDGFGEQAGGSDFEENENWEGPAYEPPVNVPDDFLGTSEVFGAPDPPQETVPRGIDTSSPYADVPAYDEEREEGMSFEDLCQAHLDSMLEKLANAHMRSGLASRVTTWKKKIEATLTQQDSRPPFDIHEYGDRLLAELAALAARSKDGEDEVQESFTYLVRGQERDQVARSFSALLQLVNNGNVSIDKGEVGTQSYCFTGERPFTVKLLVSQNKHEGMFENMIPAKTTKTSSKSRANRPPQSRSKQDSMRVMHARSSLVSNPRSPASPSVSRSALGVSVSPSSVRRSSRKRRQSVSVRHGTPDKENRGVGTPLHRTPVKLTPDGRQTSRRRPFANLVQ